MGSLFVGGVPGGLLGIVRFCIRRGITSYNGARPFERWRLSLITRCFALFVSKKHVVASSSRTMNE